VQLQIDRIPATVLSTADFVRAYLEPERPLVIEGVEIGDPRRLTPDAVRSRYLDERNRRPGWFVAGRADDDVLREPPLVGAVLGRDDVRVGPTPMRLFSQPRGHVTLPHYDGLSLHGLNLQTLGSKHWTIVSPATPLPTVPFLSVATVAHDFAYDPGRYDVGRFVMNPGDMLFLPRYWVHEVRALTEPNLSLNWVWTPAAPNLSTPTGRREAELMACARTFPWFRRRMFGARIEGLGSDGQEVIRRYGEGIGVMRVLGRLLRELLGYPALLPQLRTLLRREREYIDDNFRQAG
jgi:hypothetical protein